MNFSVSLVDGHFLPDCPQRHSKKLTSFSAWMDGWADKLADRHTDYNLDEINF